MKDLVIRSTDLEVVISTKGAQIKSVRGTEEYMWEADPKIWGKSAPVLFPICGTLKDGSYTYKGKRYSMESHGIAPRRDFEVREHTEDSLTLYITDTEETRASYPFCFDFEVKFYLEGRSLRVEYNVENKGEDKLYYSVGCHEAYSCPGGIEDYVLEFPKAMDLDTVNLEGPLVVEETTPVARNCKELALTEKFFEVDSLCFKDMGVYSVVLKHKDGTPRIKLDFPGFEYFVLWHIPGAPYICLEPWKGFPDYTTTNGDITTKAGIMCVEAGAKSLSQHTITFG